MFSREETNKLKKDCARELNMNRIKHPGVKKISRKRKRFAKLDDSKIRELNIQSAYWDWVENHSNHEPLESNPDLWEDDVSNSVD